MHRMLVTCFAHYTDMRTKQNLITCLYQIKLAGSSKLVTVTWSRSLISQDFSIHFNDQGSLCMCKVEMKPWFFCNRKGSKRFNMKGNEVFVFWDLSSAQYICGPEPHGGFYVALVCDGDLVLLLGDLKQEALKKTKARSLAMEPALLSRREHAFGKKYYATKAQFGEHGKTHDIVIECHTGGGTNQTKEPRLDVKVDKQVVLQVKHLVWKFRGNETIQIDGLPIEVFWDVHNWLVNPSTGHAVFMFQSSMNGRVSCPPSSVLQWPNALGFKEKKLFKSRSCSSSYRPSVLQWVGGSSSFKNIDIASPAGLSLLLYAWKSE